MSNTEMGKKLEPLIESSLKWALSWSAYNSDEAHELIQEAYLKIIDGRAVYSGRSSLKTWFFSVIRYTAFERRSFHRKNSRNLQISEETPIADTRECPELSTHQKDVSEKIKNAVISLAPRNREIVELVFYQGHTIEEAAAVMGISKGAASSNYHRAKKDLSEKLKSIAA